MDSRILDDIKKMLGIDAEVDEFDTDLLAGINSAFFTLYELGIGLVSPIVIDENTLWTDFETTAPKETIQEYLYLKVKMVFDPPSTSYVIDSVKDRISELEFRLNIYVDNGGGIING